MRFINQKATLLLVLVFLLSVVYNNASAQMRQVYLDNVADNVIYKISFYSPTSGFVAFRDWIGQTSDSGRTFTKKYVTLGNTNLNGYNVNILFGFSIQGVKAFDANTIVAYGDYGFVPAIIRSTDGGNSFTVMYHSQFNSLQLSTGITDMIFPENNSTGYAVDADRILKTTNQGISWNVVRTDPGSFFNQLEAPDNNTVYAMNGAYSGNKLLKSVNGGASWQNVILPVAGTKVSSIYFINTTTGWLSIYNNDQSFLYKTVNGGASWTLLGLPGLGNSGMGRMRFTDVNTGYTLGGQNTVFKTLNSGVNWEPLPRDNNYAYLGYTHFDLQVLSPTQLWAGGGHGFLELSTNGGGTPIPVASFTIDTTGVAATSNVTLTNHSRTDYTYKWFVNEVQIATTYNATYSHNLNSYVDSIKLVVSNGVTTDTLKQYCYFNVPVPPIPTITSFTPTWGVEGSIITITGTNFIGVSAVTFGGTPAVSFNVISATSIKAVLDTLGTGDVAVTTPFGTATRPGFSCLTPIITSFSPASGSPGDIIAITGLNFQVGGPSPIIKFGGIPVASFLYTSSTSLNAVVGTGATGDVTFQTQHGIATKSGFTYIPPPPPPTITSFTPTSANQGATITITGTTFTGTTAVKFGTTPASSFTVVSPTSITAVVGLGSSGKVYVTTPTGTDSLAGFTYTTPMMTSFAPTIGGTGTVVQIIGNNFTGTTSVSFGGVNASSFIVNSPTSITATVASGASGNVLVVSPNGSISKAGFIYSTAPLIQSFTPVAGPVGSSVQINGTGFNPVVANNIVYFGAVKGVVTAASPTQITATVPSGATYDPITVTANSLTSYSQGKFMVTFPGGLLTPNTFISKIDLLSSLQPFMSIVTDLDGDGKPDVIVSAKDTISYFRNTSTTGAMSFASRVDIFVTGLKNEIKSGDLNGDGKPDIIFVKGNDISVLRNTSSAGAISFATVQTIVAFPSFRDMAVADFNGDAKPDLVVIDAWRPTIVINSGTGSTISFAAPVELNNTYSHVPWTVTTGDFDHDGKTDIAVSHWYSTGYNLLQNTATAIYRNTFLGSGVSFATEVSYGVPGIYEDIQSADMDGDGRPEIMYSNVGYYTTPPPQVELQHTVAVLKNNSIPGTFSFSAQNFNTNGGSSTDGLAIGNIDGDLQADIVALNSIGNFGVLRNVSSPGAISLNAPVLFYAGNGTGNGNGARRIETADMDADSRPEILVSNYQYKTISVYKNLPDPAVQMPFCANGNITITSDITGASYQWQVNTGSGFTNITNNANYAGATLVALQITNIPAAWHTYQYRCVVGTGNSNTFILALNAPVVPAISISAPVTSICQGATVLFTAVPVNAGATPVYQWQVNGVNAGTNSTLFMSSALTNNAQVKVMMTSSLTCPVPATVTSNIITMTVSTPVTPSVSVTATQTNICAGVNVTFTAIPVNGGSTPSYQWQVNGVNAGINSPSFSSSTLLNGSLVKVIMTSNAACATPATATSNTISMIVNSVASSVTISPSATTICLGGTVTFTATPVNGGTAPSYQWQVNGINAGTNNSVFTTSGLNNNDQVKVLMTSNAACATPASATSNTITLNVNSVTPAVSVSASATTICTGALVTFTATPVNGGASPSYQWQVNGANAGTNSAVFTTSALSTGSIIRVIMTSDAACTTVPTATSNSVTITVSTTLVPAVSIVSSATTICSGTAITFTASAVNGGASPSYQWQVDGINTGSNSNIFTTTSLNSSNQVKVIMTSSSPCAVPSTATSNILSVTVNNNVTPSVSFTSSPGTICENTPVTFTATAVNGGSAPVYQWRKNGVNAGNNSDTYIINSVANGDVIDVSMTSNAVCASPLVVNSAPLTAVVNPSAVSVSVSGNNIVFQGTSSVINAIPVNGGSSPAYTWQDSTGAHTWQPITGATGPAITYFPSATGDKLRAVIISNATCANGVSAASNPVEFVVNIQIVAGTGVLVYPNPVTSRLTIDSLLLTDQWENLSVSAMNGNRNVILRNIAGEKKVVINVDALANGMYILVLTRKQGEPAYYKFIKR